jgi:hypothetical protein
MARTQEAAGGGGSLKGQGPGFSKKKKIDNELVSRFWMNPEPAPGAAPTSPMHRKSNHRHRRSRPRRPGAERRAGAGKRGQKSRRRGGRRKESGGLLTHVYEIMKLFPDESDQALAELVGRMRADARAGAVVVKGRRAGVVRRKRG